jgi:hypothetical protein
LFPDVSPCLDRLSSCTLGIISNGQVEQQRQKLTQTGFANRFERIAISGRMRLVEAIAGDLSRSVPTGECIAELDELAGLLRPGPRSVRRPAIQEVDVSLRNEAAV